MPFLLWWLFVVGLIVWLLTRWLRGPSLVRYDVLPGHWQPTPREASAEHFDVVDDVRAMLEKGQGYRTELARLAAMREVMDHMGDDADLSGIEVRACRIGEMAAEWLLPAGGEAGRRLLYIHGGAWMMGSPRSHRRITAKLARVTGASVLAIDYRLVPEHHRLACVEDCQSAYRWLIGNGPQGPAPVRQMFIAGDSAGGNLTLVITGWARDAGLRPVDAAVALAPATDGTMSGPSIAANVKTDPMIGPVFGRLTRVPHWLLLWAFWLRYRVRPCDARISPAHHDLSRLPPTLIHVSEAEMLFDDARRYANKATEAGSPVALETWPHMVHVWHFFEHKLPEAREAFEHIGRFIEMHAPRRVAERQELLAAQDGERAIC